MTQSWYLPRKFVIVATPRSGGTFLCHCLDSHPDIGCERDEPLREKPGVFESVWLREFGDKREAILRAILNRPGYLATCLRLNYREFSLIDNEFFQQQEVKFVHLYRKNAIRAVVSSRIVFLINRGELVHPVHSYTTPDKPAQIELDPEESVRIADEYWQKVEAVRERLRSIGPYLELNYEGIYAGQSLTNEVTDRLCNWFGVSFQPMTARLQRVNPWKLSEIVTNWPDVRKAFEASAWAKWLEGED